MSPSEIAELHHDFRVYARNDEAMDLVGFSALLEKLMYGTHARLQPEDLLRYWQGLTQSMDLERTVSFPEFLDWSRRAAGLRPSGAACAKRGSIGQMQTPAELLPVRNEA